MLPTHSVPWLQHRINRGHNILSQSADGACQATKQYPICNGHFIGPKLQDGGHPDPGLCALVLDVSSSLGQVVRFGGDLSPTLLGPSKCIEQIVREDRYRVAKPSVSILPAPVSYRNDLKCETLAIPTKMSEGVYLLYISFRIQEVFLGSLGYNR